MSHINLEKLERSYNAWYAAVAEKQGNGLVSFHDGIVWKEEGYKYRILEMASDILKTFNWSTNNDSKKITEMALSLLWISPTPGMVQNLVDYRDVLYFADQAEAKRHKDDIAKALRLLYVEGNDKDAFNLLAHALNKKYALISYFFFLKNSDKYQVVRPNNFAERFPMIGANGKCAINCSWDNYQEYMGVLTEVRQFLAERHAEITLTDAHSFVWMLWMLSSN